MKWLFCCDEGVVLEEKGGKFSLDPKDGDFVPKVKVVPLVDEVLRGVFDGEGDEDFAMGEGKGVVGGYGESSLAFGKHWKEIHVTWAQMEKKRDKDTTLQDFDGALDLQYVETASRFLLKPSKLKGDDVMIFYENPPRTLGDYSRLSHEGYQNTIELPDRNNVMPLRSDTIWLVKNRCAFHGLQFKDPNQHLKDFLKLVDSLDLNVENREMGSISTWEDLTTCFLAQFFPPGRTAKLRNDILMFQQRHGESLSIAWTRFKDLLKKFPHHGIDLWLQVQIFYDHVNPATRQAIDHSAGGKLGEKSFKESWELIENLALYDHKSWNDLRDLFKPVKAIYLPHDVPSTFDRRLIELENQVQRLMEAHLSPKPSK
uniref:Zinc finger, CCHC-type n=1 Tax=Tanacetum cinerariifolium TaxID=118510 RepID=A0A699GGQ5_TANCI|nr:zinc finger, CCHC-type [Tanacetum cinerariifolium]